MEHGLGPASESRNERKSPIGEEGMALIEASITAYQSVVRQDFKGFTPSAAVAALPELSVLTSLLDPSRPNPGILQLRLKPEMRRETEAKVEAIIGSQTLDTPSNVQQAKAAKKAQANTKLDLDSDPSHGSTKFMHAMGPFRTVLLEEPSFCKTSRYAAIIEAMTENISEVLNTMKSENFDNYVTTLKVEEAPAEGSVRSSNKADSKKQDRGL